jgi:hypothetical protein
MVRVQNPVWRFQTMTVPSSEEEKRRDPEVQMDVTPFVWPGDKVRDI